MKRLLSAILMAGVAWLPHASAINPATNVQVDLVTGAIKTTQGVALNLPLNINAFAGVDPTGATDCAAAINTALAANPGKTFDFGNSFTYLLSTSLIPGSGTVLRGASTLKASASFASGAMIDTTSNGATGVVVDGLNINGNADAGATAYGVRFSGGSNNVIRNTSIYDTYSAGIDIYNESNDRVEDNKLTTCGRTGSTDNHGIMVVAVGAAAVTSNIKVLHNTVTTPYRKGIAIYADNSGATVKQITVSLNTVTGAGLGGIYCSPQDFTATKFTGMVFALNTLSGNYVNLELDGTNGATVTGNVAGANTTGAYNFLFTADENVTVAANTITDSYVHGIYFIQGTAGATVGCNNNTITGNIIRRSNRSQAGTGAAIYLNNSTYCGVFGNNISDDSSYTTHGILTAASSDYNQIEGNPITGILGATAANYVYVTGTNTTVINAIGLNQTITGNIIFTTHTPSSAADTGTTGTVTWDSSYIYVCTATNTWKRGAISTW